MNQTPVIKVDADSIHEDRFHMFIYIHNFSNEVVHFPRKCVTFDFCISDEIYIKTKIPVKIFANGSSSKSKGYVSIFIDISGKSETLNFLPLLECSCVMAVIDVFGNQRFSQSLIISHNCIENGKKLLSFGFDKFLQRQTLLSDQSDLLPEDILTVFIYWHCPEHNFYRHPFLPAEEVTEASFEETCRITRRGKLFLDSVVVQKLSEVSEYFQRVLETPMKEKQAGFMEITFSEFFYLKCISLMLMGQFYRSLEISEICSIYETAHRYCINIVLNKCREFMKSILCDDSVPEISDIANMYDDSYLKEIVENYLRTKNDEQTEDNGASFYVSYNKVRTVKFRNKYNLFIDESYEEINYDERPELDFYK